MSLECSKDHTHKRVPEVFPITDAQADSHNPAPLDPMPVCPTCSAQTRVSVWRPGYLDGSQRVHSSDLTPGAMYFMAHDDKCWCWDNCDGKHLHVVLPDGHHWDVDSRASNCDLPHDRFHRCWVRHGDPPTVTVDKAGNTCRAGAGSILTDSYHGFLRNGVLTAG